MSMIALKDPKLVEIFNQVVCEDAQEKQNRLVKRGVLVLNGHNICAVCSEGQSFDEDGKIISLIKHHVRYFPEKISYVHKHCHDVIHSTKNHVLIQCDDGDGRKFYDNKESLSKPNQWSMYQ